AHDREAFENIQGNFFSSSNAAEAILQKRFAEELLGIAPKIDESSNTGSPSPALQPLLGKELVMYYAQRLPPGSAPNGKSESPPTPPRPSQPSAATVPPIGADGGANSLLAAFSVVPQTRSLRIVGIVDADPDTLRGMGRARVLVPLDFAQGLQIMMLSDLRDGGGLADRSYTAVSVR